LVDSKKYCYEKLSFDKVFTFDRFFFCSIFSFASSLNEMTQVNRGSSFKMIDFERGSYPWMVALMYIKDTKSPSFFCGGSLISKKHVLTGKK
jgi:secreted trypsin-like serine protease